MNNIMIDSEIIIKDIMNQKLVNGNIVKDMVIPIILGVDIESNKVVCKDLTRSHFLIDGPARSGKTELLKAIINSAKDIDEKFNFLIFDLRNEFNTYKNSRNIRLINNEFDIIKTFDSIRSEVKARIKLFVELNIKNIDQYNKKYEPLPYFVIIIDDYIDVKDYIPKDINYILHIGNAVGITVVYSIQRIYLPIFSQKDQFNTRISFNNLPDRSMFKLIDEKNDYMLFNNCL